MVTLATIFAGSAVAGLVTPLSPFLDVEAEDELAHPRRQAPLLIWRHWAGFLAVSAICWALCHVSFIGSRHARR